MFRTLRSIVIFLTLIVFAVPAYADPECSSRVFDSTGKANTDAIKAALNPLISDGADPMVRIITAAQINAAGGNIDKYAQGMVRRCSAWQSPGGNMKSNLLILAVTQDESIDSQVGIYFSKSGPLTALRGQTAGVRSEMASTLKSDITTSIQNGIKAMHSKLSSPIAKGIVAGGNVTVINKEAEKPMNLTFLWVLLFLGVVGAAIWLYVKNQSVKAKCRAAQQKAQGRRAECNNLLIGFDSSMAQLGALLSSFKSVIHSSEFQTMQTKLGSIQTSINIAKAQFTNLQGSSNDPDSVGLTTEEYDAMTSDFDRSLQTIQSIDSSVNELESYIRKINSLKKGAEPAIEALTSEIDKATQAVTAEKILKTDVPKATLQQAITLAERANVELTDKRFKAVADTCHEATTLAQKAAQQVRNLSARKASIDSDIKLLDSATLGIPGKLITADATINMLRTNYDETVAGKANESRALIIQKTDERRQAMMRVRSASTLQNWDLAEQSVDAVKAASQAIDSALANISDIGPQIERQKAAVARAMTFDPPQSYRSQGSRSSYNTVNKTTIVVGARDPFYDCNALDAFGNAIELEELSAERRELRREREDLDDHRWGSRQSSRDSDMDGDSGPANTSSSDFDMDGDSGSTDTGSDSDFSSGDD